jgi:hypothetical protein
MISVTAYALFVIPSRRTGTTVCDRFKLKIFEFDFLSREPFNCRRAVIIELDCFPALRDTFALIY